MINVIDPPNHTWNKFRNYPMIKNRFFLKR